MKFCITCKTAFNQRGRNHKRCDLCAREKHLANMKSWHEKHRVLGNGSGSTTGIGEKNHMYKHGQCVFRRWAREKLQDLNNSCERCGIVIDVSKRGSWAGHHMDHDRSNNVKTNLEVLCKRCHQIHHKCWTAFQGVTTIPKGSTQETVEAPNSK